MTSEPDLFDDLPPPSGPKHQEPTEEEITKAIEQTIDDDGICLPRNYVRDMLAGRDPTDPKERTPAPTCGNCGFRCPSRQYPGSHFCDISLLIVEETAPGCRFWRERKP